MLIPSGRHTAADLDLWGSLEEADRIHATRPAFLARVARAREAIRAFADAGPCYASVSWGKDSTVLAWLVRTAAPEVPLVHLRALPVGNPDCEAVRDAFLARWPGPCEEVAVDYRGIARGLGPDALEREKDRLFYAAFRAVEARVASRHISGIRGDESRGRRMRMRRWGLQSPCSLAPLGWWTAADAFACLAAYDLPAHPAYAMLGGGRWDRRHVRVDELGGDRGGGLGRREWEAEYYGDALRRIDAAARPSR